MTARNVRIIEASARKRSTARFGRIVGSLVSRGILLFCWGCFVAGGFASNATATPIASDSAGNSPPYTSGSPFAGLDGGNGFGAWVWSHSGSSTNQIAAGPVFEVKSSGFTDYSYISRPFDTSLGLGETFSFLISATDAGGEVGGAVIRLLAASESIAIFWDGNSWEINDGAVVDTGVTTRTQLSVSFKNTNGLKGYQLDLGSYSHTGTITKSGTSAISKVQFEANESRYLQFNNLSVVPEPSTWALGVAASGCGGWHVIRRRRRGGLCETRTRC
jgi:hypothetical protein